MANFYGSARTNYFKVKDAEAFKAWLGTLPDLELISHEHEGETYYGFLAQCPDSGCFPSYGFDRELDEPSDEPIDWAAELSVHLQEGQVAIMMECGAEKLRYLAGWANAIYSDGREVWVSITDIYDKAARAFGVPLNTISKAEY